MDNTQILTDIMKHLSAHDGFFVSIEYPGFLLIKDHGRYFAAGDINDTWAIDEIDEFGVESLGHYDTCLPTDTAAGAGKIADALWTGIQKLSQ